MVNKPPDISEVSVLEQRESLQERNPDKLAWVFSNLSLESEEGGFKLVNLENVLACYPNQLEDWQIDLWDDFSESDIVILNMWALRKWEIEVIAWDESKLPKDMENPVLLSPWVVEYWEWKSGKKYVQTVLRDGWKMNTSEGITSLADANQRTTTAGRNFSGKLHEDLDIENAEESPFLMKDEQWEYVLIMPDIENKHHLIASIKWFLENKYLSADAENFKQVKKAFEKKFKGVKYEDLGSVLEEIIEKDNIQAYEYQDWDIKGIDKQNIQLGDEKGEFYIYHDEANNTIEYRAVREITAFPEWLKPVWRVPLRLFLESQNQDPSLKRVDKIWKYGNRSIWLVPTMEDVAKRVSETI